MSAFAAPFSGLVAPMDRENVDTDAIIPKQFLKSTARTGYGDNLFDAWRFDDVGEPGTPLADRRPNPFFVLNLPRYQGATVLLARSNFGCGSSREHAPWALQQFGFRAVLAPSFGDIFANNALKNGLIVIPLAEAEIDALFREVAHAPGYAVEIDLPAQTVRRPGAAPVGFAVDAFRKRCMLDGVDEISLALSYRESIRMHEQRAAQSQPWLFKG